MFCGFFNITKVHPDPQHYTKVHPEQQHYTKVHPEQQQCSMCHFYGACNKCN